MIRTPPSGRHRRKRGSKLRVFLPVFGILFLLSIISLGLFVAVAVAGTPKWNPAVLDDQKQSSIVFDKDGNQIAQLHADENRLVATSQQIPVLVKKTFVAVEDKRFYQHFGVDPVRIIGSAINDIRARSAVQGASTITIQLARNAFIENPTQKTFTRKIQEVALAIRLEHEYTKDQILTFYLNKIFFGESSFGIRAAAETYFGKDITDPKQQLTPAEIALLAGLPQAPSGYDPYVHPDDARYRRNVVLGVMKDAGLITTDEYTKAKDAPFTYVEQMKKTKGGAQKTTVASANYKFPYFVDYVIEQLSSTYKLSPDQIFSGGLKIYTTVDPKIQAAAEAAFADPGNFPQGTPDMQVESAMTVVEPSTGAIRAMVGGRNYTPRGLNRAWQSDRQPGSTIKPLVVYGPAIEKGGYYPGTVLDDMPVKYNGGDGKVWAPVDFDTEDAGWKGLITMRYALEDSVNVYAVKLLNLIGVENGWKFGKEKLGLPLADDEKNNLSLALGTTHVSTLDMASAYGVYANNGVRVTHHAIEKVVDSQGTTVITPQILRERVMKETTTYLINNLLHSVVTNGTAYAAKIGNWYVCGKTGTTSLPDNMANKSGNPDAWFAGYTPLYSGVVWMGYDKTDDQHYLHKVYGGSYPARIWHKVMTAALEDQPVQSSIQQPPGIVNVTFDTKSGLLPSPLTPPDFIGTEIAAQTDVPTRISDVWVQKDVDADHPDMLAGPNTQNRIAKVFLNLPGRDPSVPYPPSEAPYKMPTVYAPEPEQAPTQSVFPPPGDQRIPVPKLGKPSLDNATGKMTIPIDFPADSDKYAVVLYLAQPGHPTLETIPLTDVTAKSTAISIVLSQDGNPLLPGNYTFWAALKDPVSSAVGPPSNAGLYALVD